MTVFCAMTFDQSNKKKLLDELLNKLEEKKIEDIRKHEMQGRAIGKSKDGIFLSIADGVVEIPISEIDIIKPLPDSKDFDLISVSVKDLDKVKYKRKNLVFRPSSGDVGSGGETWSNGGYSDTATVTGGRNDATDDTYWIEEHDDWRV